MTLLQEIEQNAQEIRRLLNVPTHTDLSLMLGSLLQQLDEMMWSLSQPIGAIIAWHKHAIPNMPPLPPHWVECNGQILEDPTSPLNGVTLPSLNTTNLFLRGATASGGTGGSASHNHGYNATTDVTAGTDTSVVHPSSSTTTENHLPPYFEVVWVIRIR